MRRASATSGNTANDSLPTLKIAIRLRPDLSDAWNLAATEESIVNPQAALPMAEAAVNLDPDNWRNQHTLGLIELQLGKEEAAKTAWRAAARLNTGFDAHFEAANLAYLLGDTPGFWSEMKLAARIAPPGTIVLALQDAVRLEGYEPDRLLATLPNRPDARAAAVVFLAQNRHLDLASQIWDSTKCPGALSQECGHAALALVGAWQKLAAAEEAHANSNDANPPRAKTEKNAPGPSAAMKATLRSLETWNQAVQRGALPGEKASLGRATDGALQFPWIGGYTWQPASGPFRLLSPQPPAAGNIIDWSFPGDEQDHVPMLWQWVAVEPGSSYTFSFDSRANPPQSIGGVKLKITLPNGALVASSPAYLGNTWRRNTGKFTAPRGTPLTRVALSYDRPFGQPLLQGDVFLRALNIHPLPATNDPENPKERPTPKSKAKQ